MEHDVFFSYPHEDAAEVVRILEALRAGGLNVWIDRNEIRDYESITKSIMRGLARSKVILSFYSLNYSYSRACQWELTAAFLSAQREGDPRNRVLIINTEQKAEHIHPVQLRDELFQKSPSDSEFLEHLVSSVKDHVSKINGVIGEIYAFIQPRWYGRKGIGSNRFVGRLPDMWNIHSALHASEVPVITGKVASAIAQVHGMGGTGKSLLAEEYALRYAAAFPGGVFWLKAFGNDDAKTQMGQEEREAERIRQILDIAIACGIPFRDRSPKEIEAHLARELERNGKPFLWVVDDLPSGMNRETQDLWLAPHPLGKTLITTRTTEYDSLGTRVHLHVLEPKEACKLLSSWRKPCGKEEENDAWKLIEDLGYHALAVDIAGAALKKSEGLQTFAVFREDLVNWTGDELELAAELTGTLPTGHEKSIASTFLRSIERLSPEGWDFLRLAAVLAVAPIPAPLVEAVFSEVDNMDEASANRKARRARSQAENLSLVEMVEEEAGARSVHTLISRTIRFHDPMPKRREKLRAAAVTVLTNALSTIRDARIRSELGLAVTHARELMSRGKDVSIANLIGWVARYDYFRGAYESAETLYRRQWEIQNRLLGAEHSDTLNTMNSFAETLRSQGNLSGARKLQEQVLKIRRRVLGVEQFDTLTSMNNLAGTLRSQGDLLGARKLQEQVLKIQQRVQGPEDPYTLVSMSNLAGTLMSQGDLLGARKFEEQVLEIRQRVLGAENPDTLTSMHNLAVTLALQGDLSGARKLNKQVLEIRQRVLGAENPDTLLSMNNLAGTLNDQGDLSSARKLHERVLEIQQRVLGAENPDTLASMNRLAVTLYDQGDFSGARKLHEQVLEIRQRVLGAENPDTLISMNNLAEMLMSQGDFSGARKLHERVLEIQQRVLGAENPDTLASMNSIALTLTSQGDFSGARKLQEQVLEMRRRVLGAENPETLTSMNNLAGTLNDLGDFSGARKLQEQVLEIIRSVLGAEHPNTLTSMNNLAETLNDQGDFSGARKLQEQVLETRWRVLGAKHPKTLLSMNNLAATLRFQDDLSGAQKLLEQVLEIVFIILGAEHPDTLASMNNLADILSSQGDFSSARKLQEQVLEIACRILGAEHPNTLTSMNNLAVTLTLQGDFSGARKLLEQVLEIGCRVLGAEHPDTSLSAFNLLNFFIEMNDSVGAGEVLKKHLLWLLDCDPTSLGANQREIQRHIQQMIKV